MSNSKTTGNAGGTSEAEAILRELREAGEKMTARDRREQTISYAAGLSGDDGPDNRQEAEQCIDKMHGTAVR